MPELPEVETARRLAAAAAVGQTLIGARCLRPGLLEASDGAPDVGRLVGGRLLALERRAKYLLWRFDRDPHAILHLRMTGQLAVVGPAGRAAAGHPVPALAAPLPAPTTHLILEWSGGATIYLQDPRHFARLTLLPGAAVAPYLAARALGPEPLDPALTAAWLAARLAARGRAKLKPLLLDQTFVAGLGNIYVDEALHLARLHPERAAGTLDAAEVGLLHGAMRQVLEEALAIGGARIHATRATQVDGFPRVHGRRGEACARCGAAIAKTVVGGRGAYRCPVCQPAP